MIISHRYKFILITPPKTASTSLHAFLSQKPFCGEPWSPAAGDQHFAAIPGGCEGYEVITCWRHPLDREVSLWGHSQSKASKKAEGHGEFSFEHFVREWQPSAGRFYAGSQKEWLNGIEPSTVVRFTHLHQDLMQLRPVKEAGREGFPLRPIKILNRSKHPHWRRCYTPGLKRIVLQRFADDFLSPLKRS